MQTLGGILILLCQQDGDYCGHKGAIKLISSEQVFLRRAYSYTEQYVSKGGIWIAGEDSIVRRGAYVRNSHSDRLIVKFGSCNCNSSCNSIVF
jgi:hypothetical protein